MRVFAQAPTRISLFGGGTDVSPYCDRYGGLVINMAINLRQKMILYSDDDLFAISNSFPYEAHPQFCYSILEEFNINGGHLSKIKSEFDGIIGAGLGSSGSAGVCLVGAINKRLGLNLTLDQIAEKAWEIEVKKIGHYGGKQDQYVAAYGGVNAMEIGALGIKVTPLTKDFIEPLVAGLSLFYIGGKRKSKNIQKGFLEPTKQQIASLHHIKKIALEAITPIGEGEIEEVGKLLHLAWEFKKKSNPNVSNKRIDEVYEKGRLAGALGGKILGAGSMGYMLFICKPEEKPSFITKMKEQNFEEIDFSLDWNGLEARIL